MKDDLDLLEITSFTVDYSPPGAGSRHRFHPPGPPRRGLERLCEVLRLAHYLACLEFHDAHRVEATPLIGDHILGDPKITLADNPPDGKARRFGRVVATKGLHVVPPADPLPRLWHTGPHGSGVGLFLARRVGQMYDGRD